MYFQCSSYFCALRVLRVYFFSKLSINASVFIAFSVNHDSLISLTLYKKIEAFERYKFQPVSIDLFITLGKSVKIVTRPLINVQYLLTRSFVSAKNQFYESEINLFD